MSRSDLKPANLLVNQNCDLAICDFGLARGVTDSPQPAWSMDGMEGESVLHDGMDEEEAAAGGAGDAHGTPHIAPGGSVDAKTLYVVTR